MYRDFRYEDCYRFLDQLLRQTRPEAPGYTDALVYCAASAYMIGKEDASEKCIERARQLDPFYLIDANEFTPEIGRFFSVQDW